MPDRVSLIDQAYRGHRMYIVLGFHTRSLALVADAFHYVRTLDLFTSPR